MLCLGQMESQFYHFQDPQDRASKRGKKGLLVLLIIVLLAGGLLYAGLYKGIFSPIGNTSSVTPTPTEYQFPTDTPTPEITTSPSSVPTITNSQVSSIDKATNLDRSSLSIAVENGSGEIGAGNKASDILKNLGYHVISVGNADVFTYESVSIQMKKSKADYLPLLKSDLAQKYTVGTASADKTATTGADAVVIIGK